MQCAVAQLQQSHQFLNARQRAHNARCMSLFMTSQHKQNLYPPSAFLLANTFRVLLIAQWRLTDVPLIVDHTHTWADCLSVRLHQIAEVTGSLMLFIDGLRAVNNAVGSCFRMHVPVDVTPVPFKFPGVLWCLCQRAWSTSAERLRRRLIFANASHSYDYYLRMVQQFHRSLTADERLIQFNH